MMILWFIEWAVYITALIGVGVVIEMIVGTLDGEYRFTREVRRRTEND